MKTYISTNANFRIVAQFDDAGLTAYAFLGSVTPAKLQVIAGGSYLMQFDLVVNHVTVHTVSYYTDYGGLLEVQLWKLLKIAGAGNACEIVVTGTFSGVNDTITMPVTVVDGVSYLEIMTPAGETEPLCRDMSSHCVLPPNVMLAHPLLPGIYTESSMQNSALASPTSGAWYGIDSLGTITALTLAGARNNSIYCHSGTYVALKYSGDTGARVWNFTQLEMCEQAVALRWTSLTGALRLHVFRVADVGYGVTDQAKMLTIGDGFNEKRNIAQTIRVFIDGLTRASWWYYADMMAADDLSIYTINCGHALDDGFLKVSCAETQLEMPTGNGFHRFEMTLNYKNYAKY